MSTSAEQGSTVRLEMRCIEQVTKRSKNTVSLPRDKRSKLESLGSKV